MRHVLFSRLRLRLPLASDALQCTCPRLTYIHLPLATETTVARWFPDPLCTSGLSIGNFTTNGLGKHAVARICVAQGPACLDLTLWTVNNVGWVRQVIPPVWSEGTKATLCYYFSWFKSRDIVTAFRLSTAQETISIRQDLSLYGVFAGLQAALRNMLWTYKKFCI